MDGQNSREGVCCQKGISEAECDGTIGGYGEYVCMGKDINTGK